MKKLGKLFVILFLSLFLGSLTSCAVRMHTDNERHHGWFHHDNDDHRRKGAVIVVEPNRERHDNDNHEH